MLACETQALGQQLVLSCLNTPPPHFSNPTSHIALRTVTRSWIDSALYRHWLNAPTAAIVANPHQKDIGNCTKQKAGTGMPECVGECKGSIRSGIASTGQVVWANVKEWVGGGWQPPQWLGWRGQNVWASVKDRGRPARFQKAIFTIFLQDFDQK